MFILPDCSEAEVGVGVTDRDGVLCCCGTDEDVGVGDGVTVTAGIWVGDIV